MPSLFSKLAFFGITPVLAGQVEWSWTPCDGQTSVTSLSSAPAKPELGSTFTASGSIKTTVDVKPGSTLHYSANVDSPMEALDDGTRVKDKDGWKGKGAHFSGSADLCNSKVHVSLPMGLGHVSTEGFSCPAKAGDTMTISASAEATDAIRWVFPSGGIQLSAKNHLGEEFMCVNAVYKISGWEIEGETEKTRGLYI